MAGFSCETRESGQVYLRAPDFKSFPLSQWDGSWMRAWVLFCCLQRSFWCDFRSLGGSLGKPRWAIGFGLAATRGLVTRPGEFLACGVKLCPSRTSRPGRTRAAKVWAAPRPRSPALRWSHCSQSLLGAQARRECVVMSQTSSRERHAGPGASNRRGLD